MVSRLLRRYEGASYGTGVTAAPVPASLLLADGVAGELPPLAGRAVAESPGTGTGVAWSGAATWGASADPVVPAFAGGFSASALLSPLWSCVGSAATE